MVRTILPKILSLAGGLAIAGLAAISVSGAQDVFLSDATGISKNTLKTEISFLQGATIKGGSGKVEESSLDMEWDWSFLSIEYQGKSYNWESPAGNPFSPAHEPVWNTLNTLWFTVGYSNSITRKLSYSMDADVFISFEREHFGLVGNDLDGVLFYSLPCDWYVYGGMAVHHSPFQMDVYPLLGIMHGDEFKVGWTIKVGIPETKVQYRFNSRYSMDTGFSVFNVDYYLLAIDNVEDHDRYLETSNNRLSLVFNMRPNKNLCIGAGIQYTVDNKFMFYSENQQNRTTYQLSSVPGLLLEMQYYF